MIGLLTADTRFLSSSSKKIYINKMRNYDFEGREREKESLPYVLLYSAVD